MSNARAVVMFIKAGCARMHSWQSASVAYFHSGSKRSAPGWLLLSTSAISWEVVEIIANPFSKGRNSRHESQHLSYTLGVASAFARDKFNDIVFHAAILSETLPSGNCSKLLELSIVDDLRNKIVAGLTPCLRVTRSDGRLITCDAVFPS